MNKLIKLMLKVIGFEEIWTLGFRSKTDTGLFNMEEPFCTVKDIKENWYADPLLFEHEGKEYCFFEMYDRRAIRGCIGAAEVTENGIENIRPVIKEPFHMSYPTVFKLKGGIFMIPECSETGSIRLYRCKAFPDIWECIKVFEEKPYYTDTNIIYTDGDTVILDSSVFDASNPFSVKSVWNKLKIDTEKQIYELTPLKESGYSYLERNGGGLTAVKDTVYVPKQISKKNDYGSGLSFFQYDIQGLGHKKDAEDKILADVLKTDCSKKITGIHTFSGGNIGEVIDIRLMVFNPHKWIWRIKKRIHMGG